jgi:excisionase family DNA binding protein
VPAPHDPHHRRPRRPKSRPALPRPEDVPTLTVEQAAAVLGIGKSSAYAAVNRGEIPAIRLGHRVLIPTAALHRLLGLSGDIAS